MTTILRPADARPDWLDRADRVRRWPRPVTSTRQGLLARNPAWPVAALLVGYPIWWLLGVADFMWIVLAVPMTVRMIAWAAHGTRRIKLPPGFGIWLLFLIAAIAGVLVLNLTAPGTIVSPVSHRVLSYANRTLTYLGVTVLLLYVGNLTEKELPRRRLAWMLGLIAVYATIGGLAALAMPHLTLPSPALHLLPKSARANTFIQASMHPALAQVQNVLGTAKGRPKAPFDYTNTWGECLTIMVPWLLAGWWVAKRRWQRLIAVGTVIACIPPFLYSLNRTAWVAAGLAVGYLAVRMAAKGRIALLAGTLTGIALVGILVLATPLQSVVAGRLSHPHKSSDQLRSGLASLTIADALSSPIIGYGDTRQKQGSSRSIAIGPYEQVQELRPAGGRQHRAAVAGDDLQRLHRRRAVRGLFRSTGPGGSERTARATAWRAAWCCCSASCTCSPTTQSARRWASRCSPTPCSGATTPSSGTSAMLPVPAGSEAPREPQDRAGLGDVARGSTLNLAGAALSAAATLGVTIAVTRAFTRPVAGAFFAATSLFLIMATVANLGAYNGLIYFIAQLRSLRSRGRVPALLRAAVVPVVVASLIGAAVLVLLARPLADLLLGGHLRRGVAPSAVAMALRGLAITLPFAALLETYLGASRGYRDMRPTVVVDRIGRSGLQLIGVGIAALPGSAALLAPLWALPYVPASVLAWVWFHRVRQRAHRLAAVQDTERSELREAPADRRAGPGLAGFWRFNAPRALASLAQMIIQRLDIVLVGSCAARSRRPSTPRRPGSSWSASSATPR